MNLLRFFSERPHEPDSGIFGQCRPMRLIQSTQLPPAKTSFKYWYKWLTNRNKINSYNEKR